MSASRCPVHAAQTARTCSMVSRLRIIRAVLVPLEDNASARSTPHASALIKVLVDCIVIGFTWDRGWGKRYELVTTHVSENLRDPLLRATAFPGDRPRRRQRRQIKVIATCLCRPQVGRGLGRRQGPGRRRGAKLKGPRIIRGTCRTCTFWRSPSQGVAPTMEPCQSQRSHWRSGEDQSRWGRQDSNRQNTRRSSIAGCCLSPSAADRTVRSPHVVFTHYARIVVIGTSDPSRMIFPVHR